MTARRRCPPAAGGCPVLAAWSVTGHSVLGARGATFARRDHSCISARVRAAQHRLGPPHVNPWGAGGGAPSHRREGALGTLGSRCIRLLERETDLVMVAEGTRRSPA
jgi:hypothetical protein